MKTFNDVMFGVKAILQGRDTICYVDVKKAFLAFNTTYATKKQFVKKYSPSRSFSGFINLREFVASL